MSDPWDGERPDGPGIDSLYVHLHDVWSSVREKMAEVDSFKNGTFNVWNKSNEVRPSYHPPKARYLIDHAVDTQLSVDPKIKKFSKGRGGDHAARADRVEPALTAVMLDAAMKETSIPWRQAYSYLIAYGYTVMGQEWDESDKPVKPKRKDGEPEDDWKDREDEYDNASAGWNPVRIKAPHPSRVLMNPYDMQPKVAVIAAKRYSQDLANLVKRKGKYGSKSTGSYTVESNPYKLIDTLDVWTDNWHALKLKSGEVLVSERNWFGFTPWIHGFAGWGGEQANSEEADPKDMAVGMITGILELLRVDAQKASALHNAVLEHGFARMGAKRPEEMAAALAAGTEAIIPGEKDDAWWLQYPEVSRWMFQSQDIDNREIEAATYIRALTGERQQGVTTVGQQMILTQAANKKFYVPAKMIEHMATIIASRILRQVVMRKEPIILQGYKLTPPDIDGSFEVNASFQQFDPLIQMDMRRLGMQEVSSGLKSAQTYRESDALIENEAEEQKRLVKAEVYRLPEVHAELLALAVKEEGFEELADRMTEQIRAAKQQSQGGPGGQPPMPEGGPEGVPMP